MPFDKMSSTLLNQKNTQEPFKTWRDQFIRDLFEINRTVSKMLKIVPYHSYGHEILYTYI